MRKLTYILFVLWAGVSFGQSTNNYQIVNADGNQSNMLTINQTNAAFYVNSLTCTGALETTFRGTEDLRMPLSLGGKQDSPPSLDTWLGNLKAYAFRGNVGAEQVFFDVQFPHAWEEGTFVNPHIHADQGNANSTNSVVFKLEYVWANIGDTFTNAATATIATTNALNGTNYYHHIWNFPNIDGTNKTYSSMINARLYRDPTDAGDTYTGDVFVHEFDIHYYVMHPGGNTHSIDE